MRNICIVRVKLCFFDISRAIISIKFAVEKKMPKGTRKTKAKRGAGDDESMAACQRDKRVEAELQRQLSVDRILRDEAEGTTGIADSQITRRNVAVDN